MLAWNQSARQLFRWCASWHFMDLHTHGGGYIYDCCGRLCLGPFHKANNEQSSSLGRQIYPPFPTRDAPVCTPKNTCHNNKWQNKECLDLSSTSQVTDQSLSTLYNYNNSMMIGDWWCFPCMCRSPSYCRLYTGAAGQTLKKPRRLDDMCPSSNNFNLIYIYTPWKALIINLTHFIHWVLLYASSTTTKRQR